MTLQDVPVCFVFQVPWTTRLVFVEIGQISKSEVARDPIVTYTDCYGSDLPRFLENVAKGSVKTFALGLSLALSPVRTSA